ncbi:MAG: translation elongation factor Ts [Candidatus Stygibacter frigidus]|nr:translation elongation factor Ts [Candidatus Stygibacter frigidus]
MLQNNSERSLIMSISAKDVMELRKTTGAGMMDCKKALLETNGDREAAVKYLREKGISKAAKKAERTTREGLIYSYIHANGKLGVLLEVNCETDFVARNEIFIELCKNIAMHIAATNPMAIDESGLDQVKIAEESEIYRNKAINDGKPEKIVDRIVAGQIDKYKKTSCLLSQEFVKDPDKTVQDIITDAIVTLGENIQISRFTRYSLGA